jgi:hypothetical protein
MKEPEFWTIRALAKFIQALFVKFEDSQPKVKISIWIFTGFNSRSLFETSSKRARDEEIYGMKT